MSYTPPSGNAVDFVQDEASYTPPSGSSITVWWKLFGIGSAEVSFSGVGVGIIGSSGVAAVTIPVTSIAAGDAPSSGPGDYRFSYNIMSATGYVATFGSVDTQVLFNKFAVGKVSVRGPASVSIMSASGLGLGALGAGVGDIVLPFIVDMEGGTPPFDADVYGTGTGRIRLTGAGAGITARVGAGSARVTCAGIGSGVRGLVGVGSTQVPFSTTSTAGRGAVAAGAATFALRGQGQANHGCGGQGAASQFMQASGLGLVRPMFFGVGVGEVIITGNGYGEYPIHYDEVDCLFILASQNSSFVVTQ